MMCHVRVFDLSMGHERREQKGAKKGKPRKVLPNLQLLFAGEEE